MTEEGVGGGVSVVCIVGVGWDREEAGKEEEERPGS